MLVMVLRGDFALPLLFVSSLYEQPGTLYKVNADALSGQAAKVRAVINASVEKA